MKTFTYLILLFVFLWSCSTSRSVSEDDDDSPYIEVSDEVVDEFVLGNLDEFERKMLATRNLLSDQFANLEHDMPEVFLREVVEEEKEIDEYAGYRVQIISTRDVDEADATRDDFRAWADSTIDGYHADAYVFFRPPYFRVHAGDFHNKDTAVEFSRILKQRYPEAWVVHDRIEPDKVPADTIKIQIRSLEVIEETEDLDNPEE